MKGVYGIDRRNIRRQRFARSKFAGHLRFARDVLAASLICYGLIFGTVGIFWFVNSLIER